MIPTPPLVTVTPRPLNERLWDLGHPSLAPYRELRADRDAVAPEVHEGWPDTP